MKKYLSLVVILSLTSIAALAQDNQQKAATPTGTNGANRISMNVTVARQTPNTSFGEKVNAGLHAAGSAIANGSAMVASPGQPIGGIVVKGGQNPKGNKFAAQEQSSDTDRRTYTGGRRN